MDIQDKKKVGATDLTVGPIWSKLLSFAFPILLCNLFQQLYNTVDMAVVGIFVSSDAVGAVGSTGSLISLLTGFFLGLSSGAGVVVARYFGAKDDDNVSKSVHTSFAMALVCGIFLTFAGILLSNPILRLMKSPDGVIEMSTLYLQVYFSGMIPIMLYNIGAGILRAVGDSVRPLRYLVISGVANVIIDFVFVAIFNWGVWGAAFATVLSQILACVLVLIRIMSVRESYRLTLKRFRVDARILLSIIRIGVPAGVQSMLYAISNMLIQSNINSFGADAIAGCAAYGKIDGFLYMPINAFGLAATTFTGQNMGAEKYDRVRKGAKTGIIMAAACSIFGAVIVFLVAEPLVAAFTQNNTEAVRYGITMMYFLAPTYFLFSPTELLGGVIRGAGSALKSTLLTAFCICFLRVMILLVFMPAVNDIRLVFAVYPISWAICSIAFLVYYRFGNWMKRSI